MDDQHTKKANGRFPNEPTKRQNEAAIGYLRSITRNSRIPTGVAADAAHAAIFQIAAGGTLGDVARAIAIALGEDPDVVVAELDERLANIPIDSEPKKAPQAKVVRPKKIEQDDE